MIHLILAVTEDNIITPEEYADLEWVCKNITTPNRYYDAITSDLQRLQGIIHGILIDGIISTEETQGLLDWINEHSDMTGTYPYDEIESILYKVLEDDVVDPKEQKLLKLYFSQFCDIRETAISPQELEAIRKSMRLPAICTMNANIQFPERVFCFTGISSKGTRKTVVEEIEFRKGIYNDNIVKDTNYLIVGDKNNPTWAYSCYGRKVEQAIEMRKTGNHIQIVREVDFWDATY
jgi:NAD-dependent DNA ligase